MWRHPKPDPDPDPKAKKKRTKGEIYLARELPEMEKEMNTSIPQARLIRDPDPNCLLHFDIEYTPDQSTYWYGGKYIFTFNFPENFPDNAPAVKCKTKIYHPNIDYDGNVCLNMLKEDWNITYGPLACVTGVYSLFLQPNPNDPLNHDVAKIMRDDINQFKDNVRRTLRGGYCFNQDFPKFI